MIIHFCIAVVPGTDSPFLQKRAGKVLHAEDTVHIDQASGKKIFPLEKSGDGTDQGGHAVNGEHPDGGLSHKLKFPAAEGVQTGPEDLQTPACDAAFQKIFHHTGSMRKMLEKIQKIDYNY